jgi:dTDP-glucose 4,6-dehydratase
MSPAEPRTILVTGGCGFIGSHFVRLLLRQTPWRVVNLDKLTYAGDPTRVADIAHHPRYRFVRGDVADRRLLDDLLAVEWPWAIVNFAAESHVDRSILDPTPFLDTNVRGVGILLEVARQYKVDRFLQVSTDEVYGDADGLLPRTEEAPLRPSSPYAASKAAADLLCLAYRRTYELPVMIARGSNNYGPFQHPEKLIPLVIRNALIGTELPVYGDGGQRRDWLYVEDNCRALLIVLARGRVGAVYNIASGILTTNLQVVSQVCEILAEELRTDSRTFLARIRFVQDRPGHDRAYVISTEGIVREFGWKPEVTLNEGLRHTVQWYLSHRDWLNRSVDDAYQAYYEAVYARGWGRS